MKVSRMVYQKYIKRLLDIMLAGTAIVILSPVYLVIAIVVRLQMGSPVLFSQDRIGRNEKVFKLSKFRSMTNEKDESGNLLEEHLRLTKFGIVLRSSSLDELPELFLILKGDMSIIGPRPLPTYYMPYYLPEERKRHMVRGGLIPSDGLCKKAVPTWEEQFQYDVYYAQNISFILDVKVFICTLKILLYRIATNYGADNRPHLNVYRENKK